jgi:IS1 family transposase
VDGARRLFAATGPPLKNKGAFEFSSQLAADEGRHRLAIREAVQGVATLSQSDCGSHAALANDGGLLVIVQQVAVHVDSEVLLEVPPVGGARQLAPAGRCRLSRDLALALRRQRLRAGKSARHLRLVLKRPLQPGAVCEIWSFVGSKEKNTSVEKKAEGCGDCWTWTALDADSKLILSFRLGDRSLNTAYDFMHDVAARLANRIQLTTDGYKVYLEAAESAFNEDVDYSMLHKVYTSNPRGQSRYSPPSALARRRKRLPVILIRNMSARLTSSARTSRCGCRCGGSRG